MRLSQSTAAFVLAASVLCSLPARAANPVKAPEQQSAHVAGGEILEFGAFECTTKTNGDNAPTWDCPTQTFANKYKAEPTVYFSIAGIKHIMADDTGLSLAIGTKSDVRKDGFDPAVQASQGKAAGAQSATIQVTWLAVGEGERQPKPKLTKAQRQELKREKQQQ